MIQKICGFDKLNGLKAKVLISARYEKLIISLLLTILNYDYDYEYDYEFED